MFYGSYNYFSLYIVLNKLDPYICITYANILLKKIGIEIYSHVHVSRYWIPQSKCDNHVHIYKS